MSLNFSSAINNVVNCKIENEPSFSSANVALLTAAANAGTTTEIVSKVTTFSLLPPASENKGRFILVEDENTYYFSNGFEWSVDFTSTTLGREIWVWGLNSGGRLGDGTTSTRSSPVTTAGGGNNWCKVDMGAYHAAGIKTDGTLWTWGENKKGQLGTGNTTDRSSPGTVLGGGTTWCQVAVNGPIATYNTGHTSAIKTDGTLWTWGGNCAGQLGTNNTTSRSSPGTVAGGGTTWCQVAHGVNFSAAVKTDGTLWTWGDNSFGNLGIGTLGGRLSPVTTAGGGTDWCQVSLGWTHSTAVKTDGTLWVWGRNDNCQLGDGTSTSRLSPVTTSGGGTDWCQVDAGRTSSAGVKTDGTLWAWGSNSSGRLGDGSTTNRNSPVTTAGGGTTWCQVAAGDAHKLAVKTDGTLWTWGSNGSGALGDNTGSNRCSPGTTAGNITNWCQAAAGPSSSAGVTFFLRQGF